MGTYVTQVPQHLAVLEIWVREAFDQGFVGNRIDCDGLLEQPVEQLAPAARFAPVEAEDELVEIGIQMLQADRALVSRHEPALEQRDAR